MRAAGLFQLITQILSRKRTLNEILHYLLEFCLKRGNPYIIGIIKIWLGAFLSLNFSL